MLHFSVPHSFDFYLVLAYGTPILVFEPIFNALSMEDMEASECDDIVTLLKVTQTHTALLHVLRQLWIVMELVTRQAADNILF